MMSMFLWILTIVLTVHITHSYILLTANLEDVQEIAKEIASSPVTGTLNNILRRASNLFNQQIGRYRVQKRTDENLDDDDKNAQQKSSNDDVSNEGSQGSTGDNHMERRSNGNEELVAMGKNATQYLQSIKQIFEEAKTV